MRLRQIGGWTTRDGRLWVEREGRDTWRVLIHAQAMTTEELRALVPVIRFRRFSTRSRALETANAALEAAGYAPSSPLWRRTTGRWVLEVDGRAWILGQDEEGWYGVYWRGSGSEKPLFDEAFARVRTSTRAELVELISAWAEGGVGTDGYHAPLFQSYEQSMRGRSRIAVFQHVVDGHAGI